MKIGITLNEVLRDFLGQFAYTYEKYIGDIDLKEGEVKEFNLLKYFKFDHIDDLNRFIHYEESLEVFGHADQLHEHIMTEFNSFLMDIIDEEEHEVYIISRQVNRSIPSTLFFLSKLGCQANNIRFVKTYEEKWDDMDVLITANPRALEAKPNGKISVKVEASYNEDVEADFTISKLTDFMKSEELQNLILN